MKTTDTDCSFMWLPLAILRSRPGRDRLPVALYVRNDNRAPRLVRLTSVCGPLDIDDPQSADIPACA